jgi:hypothetical protein
MDYSYLLIPEDNLKSLIQTQNAAGVSKALLKGAEPFEVLAAKAIFNQQPGTDGEVLSVTGTANQITVTGTTTPVLSIPSTFTAPGSITATTSVTATTKFLTGDGTAAAPSISFLADPDTGVYRAGANILGFTANGAGTFNMSRSGASGFLSNPSSGAGLFLLDAGSISLTAAGTNQNITLTPSTAGQVDISSARVASGVVKVRATSVAGYSAVDLHDDTDVQSAGFGYGNASAGNAQLAGRAYFWLNNKNFSIVNQSTNLLTVLTTGRFLLGTGNVDSGALLQIGTNTTNLAGGMIFGTDVGFYRSDNQALGIAHIGGTNPIFHLIEGTTKKFQLGTNSGDVFFDSLTAGKNIYFRSGNQTLAVTLDSSQRTLFSSSIGLKVFTVATLPATTIVGQVAYVTDATQAQGTGGGSTVVGGGVNYRPVFTDGSNWKQF